MTLPNHTDSPTKVQTIPSVGQFLLFLLLLGWLAAAPILVGLAALAFPATWPVPKLLAALLLAGGTLIPLAGFAALTWRHAGARPLALALLLTGLYLSLEAFIRAVAQPAAPYALPLLSTAPLRLVILTPLALGLGLLGLWRAAAPRSGQLWRHILGFDRPPLAGLLAALAVIALLTIGWPLTGALGDRWASLLIALQTLAEALPDEIFFRGVVLGLVTYHWQQRKSLAALVTVLIYVAYTPSLLVPHQDWAKLALLMTAFPVALLLIELRAQTGSLWAGLLVAWAYRAAPLLFTDPRVEMPLLTQPWQTAARLWLVIGAGVLALLLWGGRRWLTSRQNQPTLKPKLLIAALAAVIFTWGVWLGGWSWAGYPGFYNDGFLIIMTEQADLSGAASIKDPLARRAFARDRLITTATRTQAPVRQALDDAGLTYRSFYLINMIQVDGHHRQMNNFAALPGVARIMLNPNVRPYPRKSFQPYTFLPDPEHIGENIRQTKADQVWAQGFTGQGMVVAGQDTGYDWQHPALRRAYRGLSASGEVNHNYNWRDAWGDGPLAPFDEDGHGTHTMGTIVGDDGQGNQIGMAPGARWMGCRNMRRGIGNPASYTDCMEFFLAPYPLGGDPFRDGNVSLAPHVVNNSWGCPDEEGCDDDMLTPALAALKAAGIMMVVSAGNDGPGCATAFEPPARYQDALTVGAIDRYGLITGFSSRGPAPAGATGRSPLLKPDIVAPGEEIRSSLPGGKYGAASGTSMAGPHVAGLVALLWSANPHLMGQIDQTAALIRQSATPVEVSAACQVDPKPAAKPSTWEQLDSLDNPRVCACGGVTGTPNNVYGWGMINALKAIQMAGSK